MNKDYITIKTSDGKEEQVELVLTANKNNKMYILYKNNSNTVLAAYITPEDDILHGDLTKEELDMLKQLYKEASV